LLAFAHRQLHKPPSDMAIDDLDTIRGYFTHVSHQWLREMVAHRIADPVILSLIGKWLHAGAMQDGVVLHMDEGTPQGGPISCVLSNLDLHHSLDLWFEKKFKPQCRGETYLVRFVDDFVSSFQHGHEAEEFLRQLRERFVRFNLTLAEEKTRILQFGRFAATDQVVDGVRPETFELLGFKHVCGVDRNGKFALIRIPSVRSCKKFLARIYEWLGKHQNWERRDQQQRLTLMPPHYLNQNVTGRLSWSSRREPAMARAYSTNSAVR